MTDYSGMSDRELLQNNPHDSEMIAELISRYMKTVFAYAKKYSRRGSDYEELVSDGMQGLLSAILNYDGGKGEFSSFAAVCINNRLKNAAKKSARRAQRLADENEMMELPDKSPTPEESVIAREDTREFFTRLQSVLTELESRCIEGAALGMSYAEIAERLGVDKKSVDNALSRARNKLRSMKQP